MLAVVSPFGSLPTRFRRLLAAGLAVLGLIHSELGLCAQPAPSSIGVARIDITPDYPVRLSGYGNRRTEHEAVEQRIFAKALAIGTDKENPSVLITVDNCGISTDLRAEVLRRLAGDTRLTSNHFAICSSHTHSAPMIEGVLPNLFSMDIPAEHRPGIQRYTAELTGKLEQVARAALADRRPGRMEWTVGKVEFARNRRAVQSTPHGIGPVDHDLAVLRVLDPSGQMRAVLLNYACHCTTVAFNRIHGDWAGCAQEFIEADHPGVIVMTAIGCGADQNPDPRGTYELAIQHGRAMADEFNRLQSGKWTPVMGHLKCQSKLIELPFAPLPTREQWQERAASSGANIAHHARVNLARLDRGEALPTQLPYLVQAWSFGTDLAMVFLPGEVVVDYQVRLKREFDGSRMWVNGYANDVPCYIPSARVLREGGYEGEAAMVYYDRPTKFAPEVEELIVAAVQEVVPKVFLNSPDTLPPARPSTSAEALAGMRTKAGFTVELVAAEPLIVDPVAIDFGPDGKLWVVEMHDYPSGLDGNWQPGGRVKFLSDTNSDGRYDVATVFLDGIPFPTGLMAWRKGVLVCAAPDILYAEDVTGDGRADKVEKLFTGFITDNYQARVNGLSLGLDNWIYGANGLRGGEITGVLGGQTVNLSGRDFRMHPQTRAFEPVSGLTQQGRVRDDWGNWFGCDNSHLLWHYPLPDQYARRNPHVTLPSARVEPAPGELAHRVFPLVTPQERFNRPDHLNRITSACGLGLYRDDLLGTNYTGDAFICEPVHNLVTRRQVAPRSATFTATRPPDEQDSEFFASADPWFRPAQAITGPDGALWIVDMYRQVIEHPRWIPPERLATLDVRAGADRGRIYRVYPRGAKLRPVRDLSQLSLAELASALDTPNGTARDLVHREFLHRYEAVWKGSWSAGAASEHDRAADVLQTLLKSPTSPAVRLQTLCVLEGISSLSRSVLSVAADDINPAVRFHAIRLCEPKPALVPPDARLVWREKVDALAAQPTQGGWRLELPLKMTEDADLHVRYQLALSLGNWNDPRAGAALAKLAVRDMGDEWMRAAILSSALNQAQTILPAVLATPVDAPGREELTSQLIATLAATGGESALGGLLHSLVPAAWTETAPWQWVALASLQDALDQRKVQVASLKLGNHAEAGRSGERLKQIYAAAHALALDAKADPAARSAAIRLHGRGYNDAVADLPRLVAMLSDLTDRNLQAVVLERLRVNRDPQLGGMVLSQWAAYPPSLRLVVVELLATRDVWTRELLLAVEQGRVAPGEIPVGRKDLLQRHRNEEIKALALKCLGDPANQDRVAVVQRVQALLPVGGDRERGREVFAKNCAQCHALAGQGFVVGPDLAAFRSKPVSDWLVAILNPNAAIEPRYIAYEVELTDGRSLSGLIADETNNGFSLVQAGGIKHVLRRAEISGLRAVSLSLMPEGLEQVLTPGDLADLVAYLTMD